MGKIRWFIIYITKWGNKIMEKLALNMRINSKVIVYRKTHTRTPHTHTACLPWNWENSKPHRSLMRLVWWIELFGMDCVCMRYLLSHSSRILHVQCVIVATHANRIAYNICVHEIFKQNSFSAECECVREKRSHKKTIILLFFSFASQPREHGIYRIWTRNSLCLPAVEVDRVG